MSRSNFQFIQHRWPEIYEAAQEAEQQVYVRSVASGMHCRQAMELMLNWVYQHDADYTLPYQNTIAAKLRADCFKRDVPPRMIRQLEYLRRVGNNATHNRRIHKHEALTGAKYLFHFFQYIVRTYTDDEWPKTFDDELLPKKDPKKVLHEEIVRIKAAHQQALANLVKLQKELDQNTVEKAVWLKEKESLAATKEKNRHLPLPEAPESEMVTRQLYIDVDLKSAGWDLEQGKEIEFEVDNMPRHINPTGKGYIDYVLWGDDGLPLAVIEAKRTCKDAAVGKAQAEMYADCLEKKYGRRPVIFYTNGFETWLWDDQFYPPRQVHGFYEKNELQWLMDQRNNRKDLRLYSPASDIAGRYYQKEAIQRIAETFVADRHDGSGITGRHRKALIVMATGTGKTRTAIALVDILMKAQWARRVLFLADRNALVTQAKRSFNDLVGHLSGIDLTKEREDADTTRLVFSTYPTILNRIDASRGEDDTFYSVGHFDLIIVDEAHRSIYKKYEDIFHYFDALMVGLTATPRDETHRDTYQFFECEQNNPTYYYELDQAVGDGFLVPPKKISLGTKFLRTGIKYADLTEEEKEEYEKAFAKWGEEVKEEIGAAEINKWLFNKDTVVKVLDQLMEKGHKVESGDKIGKTIIFAKNQKHAEFIETVFNEQYPELFGHFARTISYKDNKGAQDLIDRFKEADRFPQIAISVDMLETGIDVPEITNLVFFKPVYSKTKFWQMIGRGTRLCENLFGNGNDKQDFFVFDCFGNFEFFEMTPEGTSGNNIKGVSQRIFELRISIAEALRAPDFMGDEYQVYRNELLDLSHQMVKELYDARDVKFRVKMRLAIIKKYASRKTWNNLVPSALHEIFERIGPLVSIPDKDEKAKLFDALLYKMQLAWCHGDPSFDVGKSNLQKRANWLASMSNVPAVRGRLPLITRMIGNEFWKDINLPSLEHIRTELRDLMRLLIPNTKDAAYTNIEDEISRVGDVEEVTLPSTPGNYLDRVKSFIRRNPEFIVIKKIRNNLPITEAELNQLEELLFDGDERGTKQEFVKAMGSEKPLALFIRSILGMERNAALTAFSSFLEKGHLTADQQRFIEDIINYFTSNGFIDPRQLYEPPFTDIHVEGIDGIFSDAECDNIVSIIREVNGNAMVG